MATDKPLDPEADYFRRQEQAKLAKIKEKQDAEATAKAAAELKALHYLHCGKCGTKMDTSVFKGVEIEICGNCGAVLLDPGELEELAGADESGVMGILSDVFSFSKKKKKT